MNGLYTFIWLLFILPTASLSGDTLKDCSNSFPENNPLGLAVDTALVNVVNRMDVVLALYGQSEQCFGCTMRKLLSELPIGSESNVTIGTRWAFSFQIRNVEGTHILANHSRVELGEYGIYQLTISRLAPHSASINMTLSVITSPHNTYWPLVVLGCCLASLVTIWFILVALLRVDQRFVRYLRGEPTEPESVLLPPSSTGMNITRAGSPMPNQGPDQAPMSPNITTAIPSVLGLHSPLLLPNQRRRNITLDVFRGLGIVLLAFMHIDGTGGGAYWFFQPSAWNGLTIYDLLEGWLITSSGIALAFSSHMARRNDKHPHWRLFTLWKILRRTVILFGIGLFLNNGYDLSIWRIPGRLQRFALVWCLSALIVHFVPRLKPEAIAETSGHMANRIGFWVDVAPFLWQWFVALAIGALWIALTFISIDPNCPAGYLGPGGPWLEDTTLSNCTGGSARYIDEHFFLSSHMDSNPSCASVYGCASFDRYGLLGVLSSTLLCVIGVQLGRTMLTFRAHGQRLARFVAASIFWGAGAIVLSSAHREIGWIPVNSSLASLSFVCASASSTYLLYSALYFPVEMPSARWRWSGIPFSHAGTNSLFLYVIIVLFAGTTKFFPFAGFQVNDTNCLFDVLGHAELLTQDIIGAAAIILFSSYLHFCSFWIVV